MKKIVSLALVLVLLFGCMATLTSCTILMGKYSYTAPIINTTTTYEFELLDKVTKTSPNLLGGGNVVEEGTYKITEDPENPGKELIVFTWSDGDVDSLSFLKGTEGDVDYVTIGGVKFVKVK